MLPTFFTNSLCDSTFSNIESKFKNKNTNKNEIFGITKPSDELLNVVLKYQTLIESLFHGILTNSYQMRRV